VTGHLGSLRYRPSSTHLTVGSGRCHYVALPLMPHHMMLTRPQLSHFGTHTNARYTNFVRHTLLLQLTGAAATQEDPSVAVITAGRVICACCIDTTCGCAHTAH
jgi:hypothetical protein